MLTAQQLIELLDLKPLPIEGGFFRRTFTASDVAAQKAAPARDRGPRALASVIYFLLYDDHFSALHRLLTDEVYHFYLGDPVEMLLLHPNGDSQIVILGHDLEAGQHVQFVAPAGAWQGSRVRPGGRLALLGTTMTPAYEQDEFELGARAALLADYPEQAALIAALTTA